MRRRFDKAAFFGNAYLQWLAGQPGRRINGYSGNDPGPGTLRRVAREKAEARFRRALYSDLDLARAA
jgi:hypothetical protein